MSEESALTPEEERELSNFISGSQTPVVDEKHNVHAFLHKVATANDTTKLGYLSEDELGNPSHTLRTYKELAVFCKEIANLEFLADYYEKKSEVTTSTSLSKNAKLIELAVINRRQVEDVTKRKRTKKGFFAKKEKDEGEGG